MRDKEETLNLTEEEKKDTMDSSFPKEIEENLPSLEEEKEETLIKEENKVNKDTEHVPIIEEPIVIEENKKVENNTTIVKSNRTFFILSISVFILLLLFLLFSTVFALVNMPKSTIIRGVSIKDINVSGLTKEQALEKVRSTFGEKLEQTFTLTHKEYEVDVFARTV